MQRADEAPAEKRVPWARLFSELAETVMGRVMLAIPLPQVLSL